MVAKLNDFSWADKSEVKRIEKEKQPFGLIVIKRDLLKFVGG
jgi:hypothetical protein